MKHIHTFFILSIITTATYGCDTNNVIAALKAAHAKETKELNKLRFDYTSIDTRRNVSPEVIEAGKSLSCAIYYVSNVVHALQKSLEYFERQQNQ